MGGRVRAARHRKMNMGTQPCAACINRRQFLTTGAATAAGLVAIACGDGEVSGVPAKTVTLPNGPVTIKVGDFPNLATNGVFVRVFDSIGVKRTGPTTFLALALVCTHQGCGVTITTDAQLDCPCHFSQFNGDGAVLRGPADRPLARFTTSYNSATDVLTIS